MTNVISSDTSARCRFRLSGRDFDDRDHAKAQRVMIVNQHMAEMLWPGESAIGKRVLIGAESRDLIEVVGVVKTGKYRTLAEDAKPYFYYPMTQRRPANMNLVMRTVDPRQLAGAIRKEVQNIDRSVPVSSMKTMTEHLTYALWAPNMAASLSLAFGLLAMLLSAVGLYSVMAYVVSQRTREVGIRMALGANRADVLRMITAGNEARSYWRSGWVVVVAALARALSSLLIGVSGYDVTTFVIVSAMLVLVAFIACYLPARRATKIDPLVALRYE